MKIFKITILSLSLLGYFLISCTEDNESRVHRDQRTNEEDLKNLVVDPNFVEGRNMRFDSTYNIVGIDYSNNSGRFYYWSSKGIARYGTYKNTDPATSKTFTFSPASGKTASGIAEVALHSYDGAINKCYAYYLDGTMSVGMSNDLDYYAAAVPFVCTPGKNPSDIVGLSINNTGLTFTWYIDGTVSTGSLTNLGSTTPSYNYTLPPGKTYSDIVSMSINLGLSDRVYTWYSDNTVSVGISNDLDYYSAPVPFD